MVFQFISLSGTQKGFKKLIYGFIKLLVTTVYAIVPEMFFLLRQYSLDEHMEWGITKFSTVRKQ